MRCALRAVRRARLLQGRRPPRRSDPTIEFHEQDNLALASLGADDQAGSTNAASTTDRAASARSTAAFAKASCVP
eukprot:COSAG06_NODE_52925_length_303_cov_0.573529_1_plen_74_part_01